MILPCRFPDRRPLRRRFQMKIAQFEMPPWGIESTKALTVYRQRQPLENIEDTCDPRFFSLSSRPASVRLASRIRISPDGVPKRGQSLFRGLGLFRRPAGRVEVFRISGCFAQPRSRGCSRPPPYRRRSDSGAAEEKNHEGAKVFFK